MKFAALKILLLILISSCSNPKHEIVDRLRDLDKLIKEETNAVELIKFQKSFFSQSPPESMTQDEQDEFYQMRRDNSERWTPMIDSVNNIVRNLKDEYDSLEFELKKY